MLPLSTSDRRAATRRNWLWLFTLAFFGIILLFASLLAIYVIPTSTVSDFSNTLPELRLLFTFPDSLARGDEGVIDLTVTNRDGSPITGTLVLSFTQSLPLHLLDGSSNTLRMENLAAGMRQTSQIRFKVPTMPRYLDTDTVSFTPLLVQASRIHTGYKTQVISILPIPYLRLILTVLIGLSAVAFGFIREQIKKLMIG